MPPVTIIYPSLRGQPLNSEDVTNAVEIGIGADAGAQAAIAEAIFDDITTNVNFPAEVVNAVESGIGADAGAQAAIADVLPFTQAGAGAVTRLLRDKARESISNLDRSTLNEAFVGAKVVTIIPGVYEISTQIQLYESDQVIMAHGAVFRVADNIATGLSMIRLRGSRIKIVGLTLDGNNAAPPLSGNNTAVNMDTNSGTIDTVVFEDCVFQNFGGYGVFAFNPGTLKNIEFVRCKFQGFTNTQPVPHAAVQLVAPDASNIKILGCTFRDITGCGFSVRSQNGAAPVNNVTISGNIFQNNTFTYTSIGAEVWTGIDLTVTGNVFRDARMGLSCDADNFVVSGNTFRNLTSYCIEAGKANAVAITGNSFSTFEYGVIFYNGAKDITISGNTFREALSPASSNLGWAVQLSGTGLTQNYQRVNIAGNTFYDNSGCRVDRVTDCVFSGNLFETVQSDNHCKILFSNVLSQSVTVANNRFRTLVDLPNSSSGLLTFNGSDILIYGNSFISDTAGVNVGIAISNQSGAVLTNVHIRANYARNFLNAVNVNVGTPTITNVTVADTIANNCTTPENLAAAVTRYGPPMKGGFQIIGDADFTLGPNSKGTARWQNAFTANRTATLNTSGAVEGLRIRVIRTGGNTGGPWTLSVGGLKNLAQNEWAEVEYTGSAWVLAAFGAL